MAASLRQHVTGFAPAGNLTFAADLTNTGSGGIGAALPGSLLVWVIAGDKNAGTITQPTDCPNMPVNDRTANVSQALAWGDADGGETVISGTVGANVAGGQIWLLEVVDPDASGPWRQVGGKTDVDAGTDRSGVTLDPITATTADGFGVAAAACDSVNTAGTPAWSNGWTGQRVTPSGGGNAGQWGATKPGIAKGTTQGTTFTRSGGTADQHSGLLAVFERMKVASGVATMGALGASGSALVRRHGAGTADLGALEGSGVGFPVVLVVGEGVAIFGALEGSGRAVYSPPTDLPLRPGPPVLAAGWAAGEPTIMAGLRAGQPEVR